MFQAVAEFGAPFFAPWSLIVSYPTPQKPYVLDDGELANGAFALGSVYGLLNRALPAISYWGGTEHAKLFMADLPDTRFSQTKSMEGIQVTVAGSENGQAIVLQPSEHELILIGYKCQVTLNSEASTWPGASRMHIETGSWVANKWMKEGEPVVGRAASQAHGPVHIFMPQPQVVRVYW